MGQPWFTRYMSTTKITRSYNQLTRGYTYHVGAARFHTREEAVAAAEAADAAKAARKARIDARMAGIDRPGTPTTYRPGAGYVVADGGHTQIFDNA